MKYILSMDTSTTVCSVALHGDGQLVGQSSLYFEKSHSGQLGPMIEQLVRAADLELRQLSAVALSSGPGSYTGLRIGTSMAKGICYSLGLPLIAVPTLEAMARQVRPLVEENDLLCPMLDARRMEVYTMMLKKDGSKEREVEAMVLEEGAFLDTLDHQVVWFFGNGSNKSRQIIRHDNARFLDGITTEAWAVGELAVQRFEANQFEDVAYFEPFYLKEFQATKPKKRI
jgi:tRNA threonylcarbamoyladenosine biosynthesis protein TsaB